MAYAGKMVLVGKDSGGKEFIAYHLTSSSRPSRELKIVEKRRIIKVFPGGRSADKNNGKDYDWMWNPPYDDPYTCLRESINEYGRRAYFASNGNQTNRVNAMFKRGLEGRSSILHTMLSYDYELKNVARVYAGIDKPGKDQKKVLNTEDYIGILGVITPINSNLKLYNLKEGELLFAGSTPETCNLETIIKCRENFESPFDLAEFIASSENFENYKYNRSNRYLKSYVATALNTENKDEYEFGVFNEG